MKFRITHRTFESCEVIECGPHDPPGWLTSGSYFWWWRDLVCKLQVGAYLDTEFRRVTRIS